MPLSFQDTPQELKDILANFDSPCATAEELVGDNDDDDDDDGEEKPAIAPGGKFIYKFCQDLVDGKITNNNADLDDVFTEVLANCPDLIAYGATFAPKRGDGQEMSQKKKNKASKLLMRFCDISEDVQEEEVCALTFSCYSMNFVIG